jgi:hypothetical protein
LRRRRRLRRRAAVASEWVAVVIGRKAQSSWTAGLTP